jgi:hypothetical protein
MLRIFPDARHLLMNFRGRYLKGRVAAVPCLGAFAIEPSHFLSMGMSPATVADRCCYHQDDLKAEEFFYPVHLGRSAEFIRPSFLPRRRPQRAGFGFCVDNSAPPWLRHGGAELEQTYLRGAQTAHRLTPFRSFEGSKRG